MIGVFSKTFSSQRPVVTNGPLGEVRDFSGYHLEDLPCALQQRSGLASAAVELSTTTEGLSSLVATHRLWFEIGTDLLFTDRVVVEGVTYEVLVVDPDVAGVGHHGHADLLEVRG